MTASEQMSARAGEIVDVWTTTVKDENRIGEDQFLVKRSDLVALVLGTMEIVLRRISRGIQFGDGNTQHNTFGG